MSQRNPIVVNQGLYMSAGANPYSVLLDREDGYWIIPYFPELEEELEKFLSQHFSLYEELDKTRQGKIKKPTHIWKKPGFVEISPH